MALLGFALVELSGMSGPDVQNEIEEQKVKQNSDVRNHKPNCDTTQPGKEFAASLQ